MQSRGGDIDLTAGEPDRYWASVVKEVLFKLQEGVGGVGTLIGERTGLPGEGREEEVEDEGEREGDGGVGGLKAGRCKGVVKLFIVFGGIVTSCCSDCGNEIC